MQDIANRYGTEILKATLGTEVSPALALAVMGIESGGQPDAVSSAGAEGLMQLIPATAERFGVTNSKDAVQNIRGGVAYLDWLMKRFDRDPLMVLAAYNAARARWRRMAACRPMPRRATTFPRCWPPGRLPKAVPDPAGTGHRPLRVPDHLGQQLGAGTPDVHAETGRQGHSATETGIPRKMQAETGLHAL